MFILQYDFFFSFTFFSFFWENASQSKHIQYLLFFGFFAQYFQATEFSISHIVIFSQDASNQSSDKSARYSDDTFQKNVIQKSYG